MKRLNARRNHIVQFKKGAQCQISSNVEALKINAYGLLPCCLVSATSVLIFASAAASRTFTTLPQGEFSSALIASTRFGFLATADFNWSLNWSYVTAVLST